MISIYDTIAISLIACLYVSLLLRVLYSAYWRNHKIAIFGAMGIATFVWVTYMHNLLSIMCISVFAVVMVIGIAICDALWTVKTKKKNRESAEVKSHKEEV